MGLKTCSGPVKIWQGLWKVWCEIYNKLLIMCFDNMLLLRNCYVHYKYYRKYRINSWMHCCWWKYRCPNSWAISTSRLWYCVIQYKGVLTPSNKLILFVFHGKFICSLLGGLIQNESGSTAKAWWTMCRSLSYEPGNSSEYILYNVNELLNQHKLMEKATSI